jgi:predicted amidophosphoribosyltransferase
MFEGELSRRFARRIRADHPLGVTIVPVPNGTGIVGSHNVFRTLEIANHIAASCGQNFYSRGYLRWRTAPGQAHKNQRSRDIHQHKENLNCSAQGAGHRVILFDDVVTTGSQLEASRQILTEAGFHVVGAYAVLEVIDKDERGDPYGWRTVTRHPRDIQDMLSIFDDA